MAYGETSSKSITGSDYKFGAKKYAQQLQINWASRHMNYHQLHILKTKRLRAKFFGEGVQKNER